MLRFHGSRDKVSYEEVGYNSRLDELQAAILRVQLPELERWATHRHGVGERYAQAGLGELVALQGIPPGTRPAWHVYVVRHERADDLAAALQAAGIGSRAYYRTPIHRQPAMAAFAGAELPATDELARTHLALPVSAAMRRDQVDEVVGAVRDARLDRPDQQPPCARHAARHRRAARAGARGARHRARLRPDGAAVRALRPGARGRSGATGAAAWRPRPWGWPSVGRAGALGAAQRPLRPRARTRLQRRHRRRAAAAHPVVDDVRLRVGEGPAHRQLPPRAGGRGARGDPARAPRPLWRRRQAPALSGAQGGVLPRRLRARPGGARRAGPRSLPAAGRRAHAARGLALPPLRERRVRRRPRTPARARRRSCCPASPSSAPSSTGSSCPSARSTPSR